MIDPDARKIFILAITPFHPNTGSVTETMTASSQRIYNQPNKERTVKNFTIRCPRCKGSGRDPAQKIRSASAQPAAAKAR